MARAARRAAYLGERRAAMPLRWQGGSGVVEERWQRRRPSFLRSSRTSGLCLRAMHLDLEAVGEASDATMSDVSKDFGTLEAVLNSFALA